MKFYVDGIGVWGPGFQSWASLCEYFSNARAGELPVTQTPKPELIPPRERRRSPLYVRLAVEASAQACAQAKVSPADVACVFGSVMGDSEITDYMGRALNTEQKLLSPTKFHNSVHNAAVGYWTISTACHQPSNSISAYDLTASVTLLEAVTQCVVEQVPVLLTVFDVVTPPPLHQLTPINYAFAAGMVIHPETSEGVKSTSSIELTLHNQTVPWPELETECLRPLYGSNPSARILILLERLWHGYSHSIRLPISNASSIELRF